MWFRRYEIGAGGGIVKDATLNIAGSQGKLHPEPAQVMEEWRWNCISGYGNSGSDWKYGHQIIPWLSLPTFTLTFRDVAGAGLRFIYTVPAKEHYSIDLLLRDSLWRTSRFVLSFMGNQGRRLSGGYYFGNLRKP